MSDKSNSKRVDILKIVEDRLDEFSKKITEIDDKVSEIDEKTRKSFLNLQNYIYLLNDLIYKDITIQAQIEVLSSLKKGNVKDFDPFIQRIQEKYKIVMDMAKLGFSVSTWVFSSQISQLIELSKIWHISFDELGSYLIEKLGKDMTQKVVDKSVLMEFYGKNVIPIWDSLVGR